MQCDDFGRSVPARSDVAGELALRRTQRGECCVGVQARKRIGLDDHGVGLGDDDGLEELLGVVVFAGSDSAREAEVDEVNSALFVHEDVGWFDVAVHDIRTLERLESSN